MTEQSPKIPSPAPGWKFLARGKREFDIISICPEGHIHLDYGNLTLRFDRDEFLAVARMVAEAAEHLQGGAPKIPGNWSVSRPSGTISLN